MSWFLFWFNLTCLLPHWLGWVTKRRKYKVEHVKAIKTQTCEKMSEHLLGLLRLAPPVGMLVRIPPLYR